MWKQLAAVCDVLKLDPLANGMQILDARALLPNRADWPAVEHAADGAWSEVQGVGPYQPVVQPFPLLATRAALLCRVEAAAPAELAQALGLRYPLSHELVLVGAQQIIWRGVLGQLAQQPFQPDSYLYVTPLDPLADLWSADGPTTVISRLVGPQGCPWDREQTHRSLRKDLLGETHEVLEAIDAGDAAALADELGDLLLQVLLHAEIGRQAGEFTLEDVHHHLATKLIRRHPHVFGDVHADTSATVLRNWDAIKQEERAAKGQAPRGTLDGIPVALPALALAQETLKKAAKVGFDADSISWDWAKLHEEIAELAEAANRPGGTDQRQIEEELGDVLLIAAKLARRLQVDAESALREAVAKYRRRYLVVERLANERGLDLTALDEAAKIALWREAKLVT
ncbi:MAG: nucleoside triphosphate pyrophosphohydrolase [Roseiflexaceae bacterium]|nr:nucleoside triphosphate pyrophosphohydrolase [Roseiflexaceae bacterium]